MYRHCEMCINERCQAKGSLQTELQKFSRISWAKVQDILGMGCTRGMQELVRIQLAHCVKPLTPIQLMQHIDSLGLGEAHSVEEVGQQNCSSKVNNFVVFMFLFCYALVWHVTLLLSITSVLSQSGSGLHTNEHNLDSFWDLYVCTSQGNSFCCYFQLFGLLMFAPTL